MTPPLARRLSVAASLAAAGAAILAASPSGAAAQRGSSIHGTVTSGDTRAPIMGARVSLVSPERVIITNDAGTYILRDVPAGKYTVYASAIGKKPDSSTVTVTAGSSATLDFSLKEGSLLLSSVIVSATRTPVDASKVASTVNVLTPEHMRRVRRASRRTCCARSRRSSCRARAASSAARRRSSRFAAWTRDAPPCCSTAFRSTTRGASGSTGVACRRACSIASRSWKAARRACTATARWAASSRSSRARWRRAR